MNTYGLAPFFYINWGGFITIKPGQGILGHLKFKKSNVKLSVEQFNVFQDFERSVGAAMESYHHLPAPPCYGMQSYTILDMIAEMRLGRGHFPAVRRCFDDLKSRYKKTKGIDAQMIYSSWFYFNFPVTFEGSVLAEQILKKQPDLAPKIGHFVEAGVASRLGLYKVLSQGEDEAIVLELFTEREIQLDQSLSDVPCGSIALIRPIVLHGTYWTFGDAIQMPACRR